MPGHLSRRRLVGTTVALAGGWSLSSCAALGPSSSIAATSDVAMVAHARADEQFLLDLCDTALRQPTRLDQLLESLRVSQRAHLQALSQALTGPVHSATVGELPDHPAQARAMLDRRVAQARDDRRRNCLAAASGPLARLFAAMSASHAVTVSRLRAAP